MQRIFLNTDVVEARARLIVGPCRVEQNNMLNRVPGGMTRRRFLQTLGAVTALLSCSSARALQALKVEATENIATLSFDGAPLWSLDATWLAGNPRLKVRKLKKAIEITLSGAHYPGTQLPANLRACILGTSGAPVIQMEHSLASGRAEVLLSDWLNEKTFLVFKSSAAHFSTSVGEFLQISQTRSAPLSISPRLSLHVESRNGWLIEGSEFSGEADSFTLKRAHDIELIGSDFPLRRAHIVVTPGAHGVRVAPLFSASGSHAYQIKDSLLASLRVETAELVEGVQHHAFLSEGEGIAVVSGGAEADSNRRSAKVLARSPHYARTVASNGESHAMWTAGQGQGMADFGEHVLVTAPLTSDGRLKIEESDRSCTIECEAYPRTLALASDADISITLRFSPPAASATDSASGLPPICPFTFHHHELSLDGAEITFKRPANALLLRFRFRHFKLVRTWRGVKIIVTDKEKCRLHLVVGAQAIVERAYFEPPEWKKPTPEQAAAAETRYKDSLRIQYDRANLPAAERDELIKKALKLYQEKTNNSDSAEWQAPAVFPSQSRISKDSQLVYKLKAHVNNAKLEKLSLDVHQLLDEELWELVVVQDAASTEKVRRDAVLNGFPTQTDKSHPPTDATYFEMPSSLYISPNEDAKFRVEGLDTDSPSEFKDIFRIAGETSQTAMGMPLRAIGTRGFSNNLSDVNHFDPSTPTKPDPIGFRTPTDMRDRNEFVWLTSQWNRSALPGTQDVRERRIDDQPADQGPGRDGLYVPRPFYASSLFLSSIGGSLKSLGHWDPPALSNFALSVERWEHSSTFARSDIDDVVYKGFLLPFGIRASLVRVTRRQERKVNNTGVLALPIQKFFIQISNPTIEYSGALAPFGGRTWPFRKLTLLLRGRLQIEDPTNTQLCGYGQSAFRICVDKVGYPFEFEIEGDSKRRGNARLAFIDNTIAHNADALECVTNAFNSTQPEEWCEKSNSSGTKSVGTAYYIDTQKSKIQYAPSKKADDTSYVTTKMFVRLNLNKELVNTAIIEASGKPPTFPEMKTASIVIPALNRLTGRSDDTATDVCFADLYKRVGFEADPTKGGVNSSEIFLELTKPVIASFSGKGDRAGAIGTPNMSAHNVSRYLGLMGKTAQPLTPPAAQVSGLGHQGETTKSKVNFNADELFRPDAKILGVLRMSDLFKAINLEEVPKFIESTRHQIDAAADEVNSKICSFAKNGISIGQGLISRLREQIRYEPVRALSQDLEVFCQALEAINCPLETFSIDEAIKQIGVAGQALENARRTADSILHSPSMLLPGSAATLVRDWSSLVTSLHESYKALKDIADNGQDILIKSIPNIAESAKRNANLLVAAELNAAYSQLSHCMEKIRAASLPVDRQIEHFLEFYQKYEAVYAGMVGWYREIDANKNEYQRLLKPIADELILSTSKTSTSYAKMVIANVEEPLKKLDSDLRHWPEKVQEDARAFFRRFEPSLLCLSDALLHLLNLSTTTANHLPQYVHDIRKSLDELERGVEEQKQLVSSNSAFYTYLNNITVEKARLGLASAAMELRNAEVVIGGQKKPVNEVLGDFESILTKNDAVVLLPVIQAARKAWQKGIQTGEDTEKLLSTTYSVVQICVIARPGIEVIMPGITELHENVVRIVTAVHDAMKKWVLAVAPLSSSVPLWLQQIKTYGYLFAPEFINKLDSLYGSLKSARDELIKDNPPLDQSASPAFQKIPKAIAEIKDSWSQLAMQLKALGDAPNRVDLSELMDRVKTDLVALIKQLIPAEVHLDLDMNTQIKDNVGSVFLAGDGKENQNSQLTLSAKIVQNLMTGSSTSEFRGSLQHFRLKLFGFLTIEFNDVTFEALKGSAPRLLPPNITDVQFEGCLSFVEQLQRAFKLKSGPYVLPLPGGIKAGYAIRPGTLPLPPMIIQDLVIDAGIEIPFDDRAATTTFAVSSRQKPALLFVAPYGGTMFFGLNMAGDRLVNVEACLDAGLVAGFDWGAVVGTGRVTLGIYFRQAGSGILLDGFFFAGGEGTVLDIVSLPLSLRIGTSWQDGAVKGYGEFSTEMGRSPFTWTLTYRVERAVNKAVAAATAKDERSNANQLPVKNLETHGKDDLFLDPQTWREFKTAFAKI